MRFLGFQIKLTRDRKRLTIRKHLTGSAALLLLFILEVNAWTHLGPLQTWVLPSIAVVGFLALSWFRLGVMQQRIDHALTALYRDQYLQS